MTEILISHCYSEDATRESGRLGRLINHSKTQCNAAMRVIEVDGRPRLCLFSLRDITVGEEILFDYGRKDRTSWIHFHG